MTITLLTGHFKLNERANKMSLLHEPNCDCGYVKNSARHTLCKGPKCLLASGYTQKVGGTHFMCSHIRIVTHLPLRIL